MPTEIGHLLGRLQTVGERTPARRGLRAYRLGQRDQALLAAARAGEAVCQEGGERIVGLSNTVYVVLSAPGVEAPTLTRSRARYFELVKQDGKFVGSSLSRAFPSKPEADCYLAGAGLQAREQ